MSENLNNSQAVTDDVEGAQSSGGFRMGGAMSDVEFTSSTPRISTITTNTETTIGGDTTLIGDTLRTDNSELTITENPMPVHFTTRFSYHSTADEEQGIELEETRRSLRGIGLQIPGHDNGANGESSNQRGSTNSFVVPSPRSSFRARSAQSTVNTEPAPEEMVYDRSMPLTLAEIPEHRIRNAWTLPVRKEPEFPPKPLPRKVSVAGIKTLTENVNPILARRELMAGAVKRSDSMPAMHVSPYAYFKTVPPRQPWKVEPHRPRPFLPDDNAMPESPEQWVQPYSGV